MVNNKINSNAVIEILSFFNYFLDKAGVYPYIPGDLRLVLNIYKGKIYWSIIKDPYIDLLTPSRMFLGKISGVYNEKIFITDQELSIEELIEDTFSIKLDKSLKTELIKNWTNPRRLIAITNHHPELCNIIKKRIDAIRKVSDKYDVKVKNKLDKETKNVWIEIERDVSNLNIKGWIKKIFESIEMLREIYKDIFNCTDNDQKYGEADKSILINQLRIHISTIYQIVLLFKDKVIWDHLGFSEWWGTSGSFIKLVFRNKEEVLVDIFISRKLKEFKPNKYDTSILIKAPQETISHILDRLKVKPSKDTIYYKKTGLTLAETIKEIKNIIQAATKKQHKPQNNKQKN